jgi:hypothetical protein
MQTPENPSSVNAREPATAVFRFLVRSFFLHPLNNAVWPFLGILTVYFIWEGTFKREHALLLTYVFPLLNLFLGNPFKQAESNAPSLFERLPVARSTRLKGFVAASALYLFLVTGYCFYLLRGFGPMQYFSPDAYTYDVVNPQGDTLTLMTGMVPVNLYGEAPAFKRLTILVGKSVIFDGLIRINGVIPLAACLYLGLLGITLLLHYRKSLFLPAPALWQRFLHGLPYALYSLVGAIILADPFLADHQVAGILQWIPGHAAALFLSFAVLATTNIVVLAILLGGTIRSNRSL